MAIVLPLLMLLTFAIGEFGLGFAQWQAVTNATREGARTGVLFNAPCNAGTVTTQVQTVVQNFAANMGVTLTPADITVVGQCGGAGTLLTVTTRYPYNIPGVSAFLGTAGVMNLDARVTMRNE